MRRSMQRLVQRWKKEAKKKKRDGIIEASNAIVSPPPRSLYAIAVKKQQEREARFQADYGDEENEDVIAKVTEARDVNSRHFVHLTTSSSKAVHANSPLHDAFAYIKQMQEMRLQAQAELTSRARIKARSQLYDQLETAHRLHEKNIINEVHYREEVEEIDRQLQALRKREL